MQEAYFGTFQPNEIKMWLVGIVIVLFVVGGSLLTIIKLFENKKRSENDHIISKHKDEQGKKKW